jgi:hypothetical protein
MPISIALDLEQRTARYTVTGPVSGADLLRFMAQAYRESPGLADCDTVCDLTAYTGDVTADDVASLAMLSNDSRTEPDKLASTAYVTRDNGFADWAGVMNHQFAGRRFAIFGSMAAAEAWLRGCRMGREAA